MQMDQIKLDRKHMLVIAAAIFIVFIWARYVSAPFFIFVFSAGLLIMLLAKEALLFYLFAVFFWMPTSVSYRHFGGFLKFKTLPEVGIYIFFTGWFLKSILTAKVRNVIEDILKTPFSFPLALFFLGGAIAYFLNDNTGWEITQDLFVKNCIYGLTVYILANKIIKTPGQLNKCLLALVIGCFIIGSRYFYFFQIRPEELYDTEESMLRLGGFVKFGKSTFCITSLGLAAYLAAILPISASLFFSKSGVLQKTIEFISFAFFSYLLILTGSRSCWIAAAISTVIVFVLHMKYTKAYYFKGILFLFLAYLGSVTVLGDKMLPEWIFKRVETLRYFSGDMSLLQRVDIWRDSLQLLAFNPLGMGFQKAFNVGSYFTTPHNIYLSIGLTNGILGLAGFIWFVAAWFNGMFLRLGSESISDKAIIIGPIAAIVSFLICGFFDSYNYFFLNISTIWIIFGASSFLLKDKG